jgi:hypothetical protein
MNQERSESNVVHFVRSTEAPNVWRCSYTVDFDTPEGAEMLRRIMSPEGVLRWLGAAIWHSWESLPEQNKNLAALEREMRVLMDLTIGNLHAHPQAFGVDGEPHDPAAAEFRDARFTGDPTRLMLHLAVETCRQMLPVELRGLDSVERQVRSLFEQALFNILPYLEPSPR